MKMYMSLCILLLLAACAAGNLETKAKIIERKLLNNNELLIKYSFQAGSSTIIDSVRTKNKVIPHDSLTVSYSVSDPAKNTLKFD